MFPIYSTSVNGDKEYTYCTHVHMYLVCTALVHRVKQPKSYVDNGVIGGFGSEDFRDVKHNKFGNGIRFQRQKLGNQKMIPLKKLTLESFTSSVFK